MNYSVGQFKKSNFLYFSARVRHLFQNTSISEYSSRISLRGVHSKRRAAAFSLSRVANSATIHKKVGLRLLSQNVCIDAFRFYTSDIL